MNIPRVLASLCLLGWLAYPLYAVDATGATLGTWTYDRSAAIKLADTHDRPLVVMFSNSSGKCPWCNRFETEINSSDLWKAYASEQQLAMACVDYNVNWDPAYYQKVTSTNTAEVTGFPFFVIYNSDGTNVLDSFTFRSNFTFTVAGFIDKIASVCNSYLIDGTDLWDPADNTAVGATILDFKAFNQRQYHDLNGADNAIADTDDWFKFLCVSGRKYQLQIPQADYKIDFTSKITNSVMWTNTDASVLLPTGFSSSAVTSASTNWLPIANTTNVLGEWAMIYNASVSNRFTHVVTNAIYALPSTNPTPDESSSTTNKSIVLPSANTSASTNGTPPDVIVPTITFFDPSRLNRFNVDAGPLGFTNSLPLTALTNGCVFTPTNAYNNSYCFININQVISNSPSAFGAAIYQYPATNLTIRTDYTNRTEASVTREIVSNAWLHVLYLPLTEDQMYVISNLISVTYERTITNTTVFSQKYTTTNSVVTEGTNYVKYTFNSTSYTLNYRLWEPGTVSFASTNITVSEAAASVPITVTRKGGSAGTVKLRYHFEDASTAGRDYEAEDGQDFKAVEGELFWADGQTGSTNITVALIQDLRPTWEGDERFAVVLTKHEDADYFQCPISAASNAVVTIRESASRNAGKITFAGYSADEATDATVFPNADKPAIAVTEDKPFTLWVSRTGGSNGIASVTVATVNGTAKAPADFSAAAQTLTWANNEMGSKAVTIETAGRVAFNRDSSFTVKLSGALNASLGSANTVTVTLHDIATAKSLDETASAAASAGAVFKATSGFWFWSGDLTLRSEPLARGKTATLILTLTGPGLLSFDWGMSDWTAPDQLACSGGVVAKKTLSAGSGSTSVLVKAGKQTVTWTYTKASATNADAEAYASLDNLKWQPLVKAFSPSPVNGARTSQKDLTWKMPSEYPSVSLGGDFATNAFDTLDAVSATVAVSPVGASVTNASDSVTFLDLWKTDTPSYGKVYKWRVDTVFTNGDGRLAYPGDVWSFTAINPDDSGNTEYPGGSPDGVYEALQGVFCDFGVITENTAITYTLAGSKLPPGLSLNKSTGRISGVPAQAGAWTCLIQASEIVSSKSVPYNTAAITITVHPLGTFAGSYNGWTTTENNTNLAYSGSGSLTATEAGALTAKFNVNGTTYSFSKAGFDETDKVSDPSYVTDLTCSGSIVKATDGSHTNTLDNLVIAKDGTLTATLTLFTTSATQTVHTVELFRNAWGDAYMKNRLSAFVGYYTVSLPVEACRNGATGPWGSGYATLTVASGGSVKLSGVLADGNAWSLATTLLYLGEVDTNDTSTVGKEAQIYVYATPSAYSGSGGLSGFLSITAGESTYGNTVSCTASNLLQWWNFKPTSVYGASGAAVSESAGFLNSNSAEGGFYDTVMNLQTYYLGKELSFADSVTFPATTLLPADNDGKSGVSGYLLLSDEALLPFGTNLVKVGAQSFSVGAKNVVTNSTDMTQNSLVDCIDFDASSNVAGLTLSLTRATGLIQGSFVLNYERKSASGSYARRTRTVAYRGVHIPQRTDETTADLSAGVQGEGFYLIPDTGAYLDSTGRSKSYSFNWSFAFELLSGPITE